MLDTYGYVRCIRGVLVRACNFGIIGREFEPNTEKPATTSSESCASSTCPMIVLRGQPAGSLALLVLNYSCC